MPAGNAQNLVTATFEQKPGMLPSPETLLSSMIVSENACSGKSKPLARDARRNQRHPSRQSTY
jgi:hypothetical protein